jgi:hypothetical protein
VIHLDRIGQQRRVEIITFETTQPMGILKQTVRRRRIHPFISSAFSCSLLPRRHPIMLLMLVQSQRAYSAIDPPLLLAQKLFFELGHHI